MVNTAKLFKSSYLMVLPRSLRKPLILCATNIRIPPSLSLSHPPNLSCLNMLLFAFANVMFWPNSALFTKVLGVDAPAGELLITSTRCALINRFLSPSLLSSMPSYLIRFTLPLLKSLSLATSYRYSKKTKVLKTFVLSSWVRSFDASFPNYVSRTFTLCC